jgi:hypothetical protein
MNQLRRHLKGYGLTVASSPHTQFLGGQYAV